ncbi:hypothetical protein HPP92_009702 [Vanilla planifolia]|uniref:Uncharacterized protein n=1 Tax=Vanilla planifolia TaxID=51239 RepID=A0A835R8D3_VANPL|nr:hypothetical protein HPP92_009702 [Vanilla planifolia]
MDKLSIHRFQFGVRSALLDLESTGMGETTEPYEEKILYTEMEQEDCRRKSEDRKMETASEMLLKEEPHCMSRTSHRNIAHLLIQPMGGRGDGGSGRGDVILFGSRCILGGLLP